MFSVALKYWSFIPQNPRMVRAQGQGAPAQMMTAAGQPAPQMNPRMAMQPTQMNMQQMQSHQFHQMSKTYFIESLV